MYSYSYFIELTQQTQARSQPDNGEGGRFPQIFDLFQGLKIRALSGCLL